MEVIYPSVNPRAGLDGKHKLLRISTLADYVYQGISLISFSRARSPASGPPSAPAHTQY